MHMNHGDMRNVEPLRFVVELRVEQLLAQHAAVIARRDPGDLAELPRQGALVGEAGMLRHFGDGQTRYESAADRDHHDVGRPRGAEHDGSRPGSTAGRARRSAGRRPAARRRCPRPPAGPSRRRPAPPRAGRAAAPRARPPRRPRAAAGRAGAWRRGRRAGSAWPSSRPCPAPCASAARPRGPGRAA